MAPARLSWRRAGWPSILGAAGRCCGVLLHRCGPSTEFSFSIRRGETLALVGESGSGKSTTGRLLIRLLEPSCGDVTFRGQSIYKATPQAMRVLRQRLQIIFQDPYSSLNPRMTVEQIIGDPLAIHGIATRAERRDRVREVLSAVELADEHAERYPHEFSGGQRQRIGIARALVLGPEFIVCDEPISALDVSIQAQIINLLRRLQRERTLSYLFISHNLSVVRHIADRVAVMYLGRIMEIADTAALFGNPLHPYTLALLLAVLEPDPGDPQAEAADAWRAAKPAQPALRLPISHAVSDGAGNLPETQEPASNGDHGAARTSSGLPFRSRLMSQRSGVACPQRFQVLAQIARSWLRAT